MGIDMIDTSHVIKPVLVIFEGADYAGKTTYATKLSHMLGIPRLSNRCEVQDWQASIHGERDVMLPQVDTFHATLAIAYSAVKQDLSTWGTMSVVMDRGYPTDHIYRSLWGLDSSTLALWLLDGIYADLGFRIVYCQRRDYNNVGYADQMVELKRIEALKDAYGQFLLLTKCPWMTATVEDASVDEQLAKIVNWLSEPIHVRR